MTSKIHFFVSVPVALVFWLILNLMFSAPYVETVPKELSPDEMLASPLFLAMIVLAVLEFILIWKWAIPLAKMDPQNHLIAYVLPEVILVTGLVAGIFTQSVAAYFYFIPLWLLEMAIVYMEVYSIAG